MNKIIGIFIFFAFIPALYAQQTEYGVCSLTEENKSKIEICQKYVNSSKCENVPSDMRKDCFSEYNQEDFNFAKSCAVDGTKKFIKDTIDGVVDFAKRAFSSATDHRNYTKQVTEEARKACESDAKVKEARERFESIKRNIGADLAYMKYGSEPNDAYMKCIYREEARGRNLGVSLEIPDVTQIKETFQCMNSASQTEFGCSVVLPAVASGGYGGVKALLAVRAAKKAETAAKHLKIAKAEFKKYENKVKDKLTPAELASLKHQQDLLDALSNPEVAARIGLSETEVKSLIQGIIDSDAGKLDSYKLQLTKASPESDMLFDVLKGSDNSKAGRAFQELMQENGMGGKGLLNRDLTNEQIREIFSKPGALQGYMHEIPGMTEAIKDVNAGRITAEEFKKRMAANMFHNGPNEGFWKLMSEQFVPGSLKNGDAKAKQFFKNTAFEGTTSADGVVMPKYPSPISKEGFIHTTFDRLSQGTGGGNTKIFFELHNGVLKETPNIPMGELKGMNGNGMDTIRGLIHGIPEKKIESNSLDTRAQFEALSKAISNSDRLGFTEKRHLNDMVRASRDRTLAYDDFMKKYADFVVKDGKTEKIILRDPNGKVIGVIDKDTPANRAAELMEKFYAAEEAYNGHPVRDLMKPRLLSNSEKAAYGKPVGLSYYYCNSQKFRNGKPVSAKQDESSTSPGGYQIRTPEETSVGN